MEVLKLGGTAFVILSLLSPNAVINAEDPEYSTPISSSIQQAFAAAPRYEYAGVADRDWLSKLQSALAEYEYHASENGHRLQAPNRSHNLRTYFEPTGIRLHDRTKVGNPELAGLSLVRLGRGAALTPVKEGEVTYEGSRVEIRRDRILEWYENSAKGVEQGFTLDQQPQGEGPLVLELAIAGAQAALDNTSVVLTTDQGRRLRYGELFVEDAAGQTLRSHLEVPSPMHIHLVIQDVGATYPLVIDPLVTAVSDKILESNDPDVNGFDSADFGGSVASAGDVNGDGIPDVIVGARGFDTPGLLFDEGAAFVFLGSATGIVGSDPATAHAVILGDQAAAEFGTSVAAAGDVNGDGFGDVIVGAPFYEGVFRGDPTLSVKGAAFVFYGSSSGIVATSPAMADARIDANQVDAILGFSVAGAGNVNGDLYDDIIIGVPRQGSPTFPPNIPPNQAQGFGGAAVVFHGSAAGITASGFDDADATLLPYPAGFPVPSQQFMGSHVSGAGDVNGDGFDDVLVFIDGTALFLGSATGIVGTDPTTAHAHIAGAGGVGSGAGNVNGDLYDDIILGAPGLPIPEPGFSPTNEGGFGVFLGSPGGITATDFSQAQTIVLGDISQAQLGRTVAAAGDIDNDGFDDVIVGALGFAGSLLQEGAAYVFRGGPSGIAANTLLDAYVRLESNQSKATIRLNRTEIDVAGLGDVNNDGFADVALGLGFFDAGELNEGAVFVYHGGVAPINPNQPPVAVAGPDQVVVDLDNSGSAVFTVDGNLSFDPDGFIANYTWLEGETLLGTSPVLTTALPATGDHGLVLTVTDDGGLTRGDPVTVRVEIVPSVQVLFDGFTSGFGAWLTGGDVLLSSVDTFPTPPQARLGTSGAFLNRSIGLPAGSTGMTVSYWGKASQFSAADELLVKVSVDGGPFTTIQTITSAASDDTYVFYGGSPIPLGHSWFPATASNIVLEFESNMSTGLFFVDDVKVRVLQVPPGTPPPLPIQLPVADAGADTTVDDNDSDGFEVVFLDGTLSTDPDGFIASHQWFEVSSAGTFPIGNGAMLGASFARGSHTVQLIVTDNAGGSTSDTVLVTVNQALGNNQPPVANAGLDKTITDFDGDTQEFVLLDGRASTDADGSIVTYVWTENGNVLSNAPGTGILQEGQLRIILPIGVHSIDLTVTDNQGATSSDTVVITVVPDAPTPPIDSFSATPTTITVGGSSTLSWTTTGADSVVINAGPNLPLDGSMSVSPTTTTLYILTATGPAGASQALVTVTVNAAPPGSPTIDSFSAVPSTITVGESAILTWTTTDADSVSINGGASQPADGSMSVSPSTTTTYTLTATGTGGTATSSVTVTVDSAPPGPSESLTITRLEYRADKNEWRIDGTTTIPGPGNAMTLYVGPTVSGSPVLGSAAVDNLGVWSFRQRDSSIAPHSSGTISIQSSQGSTWEGISGVGPVPDGNPAPPGPPSVDSFSAVPSTITVGQSATLTWTTTDADSVSINGGASQPADGSMSVSPTTTTTYTLTATGAGGTAASSVTVTVNAAPPGPPTVDSFFAAPSTIAVGESAILTWTTTDADSVSIDNGVGTGLAANASATVTPVATTNYLLTATGPGGTATSSVTVTVNPAPPGPPTVDSFSAAPTTITVGESAILTWTTTDADSVSINGSANQPADGSSSVSPITTTTFTLIATGAGGTATSSVVVTVNTAPPGPPQGSVSLTGPSSVNRGDSVSFTVALINTGSTTLNGVQLTFGVSPSQRVKNLSPASTQSVGNVLPGGSVTQTWTGRADKEGAATVSAEALSAGIIIDTATQSLAIIK